ncbi:hypothetical protein LCGC14_0248980 [marine sediment metagenome]|uniref:Uncharacterized protein n=1 Tax=marine sediment metagenome TaxID=412755 RepID=A0A0F9WQ83_9ZZZZ
MLIDDEDDSEDVLTDDSLDVLTDEEDDSEDVDILD